MVNMMSNYRAMAHRPSRQKGVASIEFAVGFFAFWLMCMAWVEMSYMSYVSAVGDIAISEAARNAKLQDDNYMSAFKKQLRTGDSVWANMVDIDDFRLSIQYLESIDDLKNQKLPCLATADNPTQECGSEVDSAIAIYRIDYDFNSMFSYFIDETSVFSREVIVIQEYQRDTFSN